MARPRSWQLCVATMPGHASTSKRRWRAWTKSWSNSSAVNRARFAGLLANPATTAGFRFIYYKGEKMAVSGAILDYTGGAGERNYTVFIQLTFSGSFTAGGDPLNLTTLSNPNGLEIEGISGLPMSLSPAVYVEDMG